MLKKKKQIPFQEEIVKIWHVGAIAPTSRFVARAMVPEIKKSDAPKNIVELGVGIGSVTEEIIKHLRPEDWYIGIDSNKKFVEICKKNIAPLVRNLCVHIEHENAQDIPHLLRAYKITEVDGVICTIPFRAISKRETEVILKQIDKILISGGRFVFIRYLIAPATKEIFQTLHNFIVIKRKIIMRNIPPAEVITMQKA